MGIIEAKTIALIILAGVVVCVFTPRMYGLSGGQTVVFRVNLPGAKVREGSGVTGYSLFSGLRRAVSSGRTWVIGS